jgi:hypothetical protein
MDQLRAAEESYRTAMRLSADDPAVLARLGFLLYGRGEDAQALALLEQAEHLGVDMPMLEYTVAQLRHAVPVPEPTPGPEPEVAEVDRPVPEPPSLAASDLPCSVDLDERSTFRVEVDMVGQKVPLIFDTGASITTLSRDLLEDLGLPIDVHSGIDAITATGPVRFPIAVVPSLGLAGRRVEQLTVAVCEGCGGSTSGGLLGLDVQAALGMELDMRNRKVRFLDCER